MTVIILHFPILCRVWFNDLPAAQFCYCNASIARFRSWLQQKYATLETLNNAWYRTFSSWSDVQPPRYVLLGVLLFGSVIIWGRGREGTYDSSYLICIYVCSFGTILTYTDYIDWMTFTTAKLSSDLQYYASAIKVRNIQ